MYKPPKYQQKEQKATTPPGSAAAKQQAPATYRWQGDQLLGMGTPSASPPAMPGGNWFPTQMEGPVQPPTQVSGPAPMPGGNWFPTQVEGPVQAPPAQNAPTGTAPMDGLQAYVQAGGDWGPFGSGVEGFGKWFQAFDDAHGREPNEQDVVDFWDSVGFLKATGRPPTEQEWRNRWYTATWGGNEYKPRAERSTSIGNIWSIYPQNPALSWWS